MSRHQLKAKKASSTSNIGHASWAIMRLFLHYHIIALCSLHHSRTSKTGRLTISDGAPYNLTSTPLWRLRLSAGPILLGIRLNYLLPRRPVWNFSSYKPLASEYAALVGTIPVKGRVSSSDGVPCLCCELLLFTGGVSQLMRNAGQ